MNPWLDDIKIKTTHRSIKEILQKFRESKAHHSLHALDVSKNGTVALQCLPLGSSIFHLHFLNLICAMLLSAKVPNKFLHLMLTHALVILTTLFDETVVQLLPNVISLDVCLFG